MGGKKKKGKDESAPGHGQGPSQGGQQRQQQGGGGQQRQQQGGGGGQQRQQQGGGAGQQQAQRQQQGGGQQSQQGGGPQQGQPRGPPSQAGPASWGQRPQGPPQQQGPPPFKQQGPPQQQGPPPFRQESPQRPAGPQAWGQSSARQPAPAGPQAWMQQQGAPQQFAPPPQQQFAPPQQQQPRPQKQTQSSPQTPPQAAQPTQPADTARQSPVPSSASSDSGSVKSKSSLRTHATADIKDLDITELLEIKQKKIIDKSLKQGKRIKIAVNHMALKMNNYNIKVVHYDVAFDPEKPFFLNPVAMEKFCQEYVQGRPIFDGRKNLFSNGYLKLKEGGSLERSMTKTVTVFNEESQREKEIQVSIAPVNLINMADLQAYQTRPNVNTMMQKLVIDVAMRCALAASNRALVQSSRKFFSRPSGPVMLGNGVELWHGTFQAAILGWKPYINIDITHKGFYSAVSIEEVIAMNQFTRNPGQELDDGARRALSAYLKGLKVDFEIPNQPATRRTFRVNGAEGTPSKESFVDENKKKWTVEQYFAEHRRCRLYKRHLPCLWVGNREKRILIPAELCRISPGQPQVKKLDEYQTSVMVKNATCGTDERRRRIMDAFDGTGLGNPNNPYLKEFGISISGKFEEVEGRVLDSPKLTYSNNSTVQPQKGQWRADRFLNAAALTNWALLSLNFRTQQRDLENIEDQFCRNARNVGMTIERASVLECITSRPPKLQKEIQDFLQKMKAQKMQLVVVVVPDSGDVYAKVKSLAEITVGVLTQCIKGKTVMKMNPATVGNILLKVNAKLNGVNHELKRDVRPACLNQPIMVVGADVTHASPGQSNIPSVAAVAASHDAAAFKYNMIWSMQPKGEMIRDLENIMVRQLQCFHQKTSGRQPLKIIFYRDGVSEGEIQKVMSQEICAIRRACLRMNKDYQPKITFVIVQKRHHTRFFPVDKRDIYDIKNGNLPAGTVIDTEIVHPFETEFLLLSHASILGTARPTKYRLVHDDSDFQEEELEKLTYWLCHLFTRCTRAVSYPAPTYYAHLAAFRARHYLDADPIRNLNNLHEEQRIRSTAQNADFVLSSPMFYV